MANILVKPISESNGNLVILADNTREMSLVDLKTGEVIESGRNSGASNGRGATFRFSRPGGAYRNVGLMDDRGNVLLTLETAGDRVQFNYSDYDGLVARPVSTIQGYRWSNQKNQESVAQGGPSNADIAKMTPEEYNDFLEAQKGAQQPSAAPGGTSGLAGIAGAGVLANELGVLDGGMDLLGEADVLLGGAEGPLTQSQSQFMTYAPDVAGGAAAGYNLYDAFGNITKGDDKGVIEGTATTIGTGIGAALGGLPGAGIGSVIGRTVGRGLASGAESLGLTHVSTKDQQKKNWGRVAGEIGEDSPTADYIAGYQQEIENPLWKQEGRQPKKFEDMNDLDLTPGLGFFEAFGRDWLEKYTEPERIEIAKRAREEGLVRSSRGDILVDDKDRLKEIGEEVFSSDEDFQTRDELYSNEPEPAQPQAVLRNGVQEELPPEAFGGGGLVESDTDVDPPITGFEHIPGSELPPPGASDNAALAFNLIQSAPSQVVAQQLAGELFQEEEQDPARNFQQLASAFQ